IEFDKNLQDKRVNYWMYKAHPGDSQFIPNLNIGEPYPIGADDIVHMALVSRAGQNRGEPILARPMIKMRDIDTYDDAQVQRQTLGNFFAGFIQPSADLQSPFADAQAAADGTQGVGE